MRKLYFCLLLFISCIVTVHAQQNHFVYIQAENNQPFYIKLNKKLYSSSASGYLILSKLVDGSYDFQIGFPKNEWPEQNLTCVINKKDAGYLLKNFGDKGWGLFDLQTLSVTMAQAKGTKKEEVKMEEKNDDFSAMLSEVVNDPTIKQKEVKPMPKQEEAVKAVAVAEPVVAAADPVKPIAKTESVERASVVKLMQTSGKEGTEMIYVDINNGIKDTIRVFIPSDKAAAKEVKPVKQEPAPVQEEVKKEEPKSEPAKPAEEKKDEAKFIDFDQPAPAPEEAKKSEKKKKKEDKSTVKVTPVPENTDVKTPAPATTEPQTVIENSNCKALATDDDFLKLRKKMASASDDDEMISAARKVFKSKCFTTDQVKNLSVLFLTDEGKYKFFDTAYPFISDPKNFSSLQSQLKEEYYISRFKAMIKN